MIYLKFNEFNNKKGKVTNLFFGLISDYKIVYKLNIQDADTGKLILDRSGSCAWSAFENDELDFAFETARRELILLSRLPCAVVCYGTAQSLRPQQSSSEGT